MLSLDLFDMTDIRLRQAMSEFELDFGGLGVSLSGDLLQLQPITKASFARRYTDLSPVVVVARKRTSPQSTKHPASILVEGDVAEKTPVREPDNKVHAQSGDAKYLKFKTVISLDVNLRAPGILGELQAAMRKGEVTQELWEVYASRKLAYSGSSDEPVLDPRLSAPPFSNHPIHYIVQRHKLRVQLSLDNAILHCVEHKKRLYCVVASDTVTDATARRHFTQEVRAELQAVVKPSELLQLPSLCFLYIGMRVLLFDKVCVRLGLVNGCECVVEHIVFSTEEKVPADGAVVAGRTHMLQYMPNALLLRAVGVPWQLPVGDLPTLPDHITDRRGLFILNPVEKKLSKKHTGTNCLQVDKNTSITVVRLQFPIRLADVCIVYGAQGESWDAVIADMERAPRWSLDDHWLSCYVMISRARTLEGLLLLRLATREELNRGAPAYLLTEIDRLLNLEQESTKALEEYIRTLPCVVPEAILKLFQKDAAAEQISTMATLRQEAQHVVLPSGVGVKRPLQEEEAKAPLLVVRRRLTGKRPLDQACTDGASVQRPRQQPALPHQSHTAKRPLALTADASTKRSRVLDAPCESTAATSHVVEEKIIGASEQTAVDALVHTVEESTERTTVDVVAPAPMASEAALPQSPSASSLTGFEVEVNDALYEELFGSRSTTSSEEPAGRVMPRWRRGVLRAVDPVSGCDDVDVEGGTLDDDEVDIKSDGGGGGNDDDGPVRATVEELERDGGAAEELRPVEDVQAAPLRIITSHDYLRAQPNLDICNLLGYTLIVPDYVDVDHTVCGLNNIGNTCLGELFTPSPCQDPTSTNLATAT